MLCMFFENESNMHILVPVFCLGDRLYYAALPVSQPVMSRYLDCNMARGFHLAAFPIDQYQGYRQVISFMLL